MPGALEYEFDVPLAAGETRRELVGSAYTEPYYSVRLMCETKGAPVAECRDLKRKNYKVASRLADVG